MRISDEVAEDWARKRADDAGLVARAKLAAAEARVAGLAAALRKMACVYAINVERGNYWRCRVCQGVSWNSTKQLAPGFEHVTHAEGCVLAGTEQRGAPAERPTRDEPGLAALVRRELERAYAKHGREPWSRHEFYAVLLEEVDELWAAIKSDASREEVLDELIQVAAMCFRYAETDESTRNLISAREAAAEGDRT